MVNEDDTPGTLSPAEFKQLQEQVEAITKQLSNVAVRLENKNVMESDKDAGIEKPQPTASVETLSSSLAVVPATTTLAVTPAVSNPAMSTPVTATATAATVDVTTVVTAAASSRPGTGTGSRAAALRAPARNVADTSTESPPEFPEVRFLSPSHRTFFLNLMDCHMTSTHFLSRPALETLGIFTTRNSAFTVRF